MVGCANLLRQTILADPADDLARLVYADWLEDHDQPDRAALIRVQVELARITSSGVTRRSRNERRRVDDLRAHEQELFVRSGSQAAQAWALPPELDDEWPDGVVVWEWHRGFPEFWWCPVHIWLKHGGRIAAWTPIQRVTVTDKEPAAVGSSQNRCWYRGDESRWADPPPEQAVLPRELFDLLPDDPFDFELFGVTRIYPSLDAAHTALSVACLEWVRLPTTTPEFAKRKPRTRSR